MFDSGNVIIDTGCVFIVPGSPKIANQNTDGAIQPFFTFNLYVFPFKTETVNIADKDKKSFE